MDAREIRIGNWVNQSGYDFNEGGRFSDGYYAEVITDLELLNQIFCDYGSYKPIPLTEDWLLRFKEIQRIDEGLFSIDGERYIELTFKGDGYNVDVGGIVICFVDTVHALQNLYFALTNQELCVK